MPRWKRPPLHRPRFHPILSSRDRPAPGRRPAAVYGCGRPPPARRLPWTKRRSLRRRPQRLPRRQLPLRQIGRRRRRPRPQEAAEAPPLARAAALLPPPTPRLPRRLPRPGQATRPLRQRRVRCPQWANLTSIDQSLNLGPSSKRGPRQVRMRCCPCRRSRRPLHAARLLLHVLRGCGGCGGGGRRWGPLVQQRCRPQLLVWRRHG